MRRYIKNLFILYFVLVFTKIILSYFVKSPMMFADDYFYMKVAKGFFETGRFLKVNIDSFPPLYSLILSISYIFKDMRIVFFLMKIINAFISSLIIIPAWLFSKEFLTQKRAFWCVLLVSLLPISFSFSPYIMSENLFIPLFLISLYFIYKSFTEKELLYDYLAGLFIGLSYLTRAVGVTLIGIVGLMFIVSLVKKEFYQIKKKILLFLTSFLIISPWIIRSILGHGNLSGYGYTISEIQRKFLFISSLFWSIKGVSYILLSSFVIFSVAALIFVIKERNNNKTFILKLVLIFTTLIHLILFGVYHSNEPRILGRYIEPALILIVIVGFIGLNKGYLKEIGWKKLLCYIIPIQILFIISLGIIKEALFPVNHMSLSYLGVLKIGLEFLTSWNILILSFFIILSPLLIFVFKNWNLKKFFVLFLSILIMLNILCYSIAIFNYEYNWKNLDQTQLGFWINEKEMQNFNFLFDKRDYEEWDKRDESKSQELFEKKNRSTVTIGYWIRGNVNETGDIKNPGNFDYIISTYNLDFQIVKQGYYNDRTVYLYKIYNRAI